jgi:hypothetical protein
MSPPPAYPHPTLVRRYIETTMVLACAAFAGSCVSGSSGPSDPRTNVLFMGNSLTYTNELPVMAEALARASGVDFAVESFTGGDFALIDHWNNPLTVEAVRQGQFDFVVLQQGPSTLPINRDSLRIATELWAPVIRQGGGKPGLYAVWPDITRTLAFPDASESYRLAADAVNGLFFPVGDTWLEIWDRDPQAELYGPDGFHPTAAGSFAAAVVIVAVIAKRDPRTLADDYSGMPVSVSLARTIREAAYEVLAALASRPPAAIGEALDQVNRAQARQTRRPDAQHAVRRGR